MTQLLKRTSFALLFSFLLGLAQLHAELALNKPVPDFELTALDGTKHKLSEFKGKTVVLEWFNPECPYVKKHYDSNNMQALQKEFTQKGVVWLSILSSAEGKEGHVTNKQLTALDSRWKPSRTLALFDPTGTAGKAFDASTTPHMFVIDHDQKLVYRGAIDDQPSAQVSSIKGAKNFVKEALESTLAGKKVSIAQTKPYGCSVKY